jgi:imidazoleglycerol-phosphate dehydratase
MRTARVERKTKESHVIVELNLDGQGVIDVVTGVPFFRPYDVSTWKAFWL